MSYGPIVSPEAQNPTYRVSAFVATENGSAILEVRLGVEGGTDLFIPETDAVFQDVLDALADVAGVDLQIASKSWGAARAVTPSE